MAQGRYGFFNSSGEDTRSYDADDMATALKTLASGGVMDNGTCLQVTAEGSTMRTLVGYGYAMIEGYYYQLRDDGGSVQAFEHTTEASLNRIDRIILRLDYQDRTITLVKLIGTAASTPEAPALTRDDEYYEISLAQVYITAAATEILADDITDEREDEDVCGLIAPATLKRSVLVALIETMVEDGVDYVLSEVNAEYDDVLRHSEQTLETAQKTQSRTNIGAQQLISASGMLKGDGSGGVSAAVSGTDYAVPVTEISATLSTTWTGTSAPYYQTITVTGMTSSKKGVSVGLPASATDAQFEAAADALLRVSAQGTNTITIKAHGDKPTISIPVLVMIKG